MQTRSLTHLLKSTDWLSDYEEQKLGEIILQAEIDNVNITLHNNNNSLSDVIHQRANYYMHLCVFNWGTYIIEPLALIFRP